MTGDMVLQKRDVDILKGWGYLNSDIPQIQKAIKVSTYELHKRLNDEGDSKLIRELTAKEVYYRLGKETFLSGISRSAFHCSSVRNCANKNHFILFDSGALFK